MVLSDDYKNIVKLRFQSQDKLNPDFLDNFYDAILKPDDFKDQIFLPFSLKEILYYLQKSHQEYLNIWFPKIEKISDIILDKEGTNELTLTLKSFLVNYFNELSNHINFEEKVLYNFVNKLTKGIYVESEKMFVLNHFLETHSHAVEDDLISIQKRLIIIDPKIESDKNFKELFNLLNLVHNDLKIHGAIEDEIFIDKIHQEINSQF